MAKPRGTEHLTSYLKEYRDQFVIIGGGAAAVLLDDQGLEFRATKDIDIVLLTNGSTQLIARISEYIREGGYQIKEATEGSPRYYRFQEPNKEEFPLIVEIFARNEQEIELRDGQYIIPIQNDAAAQISAILLDEEYFQIIRTNCTQDKNGIPIINALANICLKARAHRELSDRKLKGDDIVDAKDIRKHRGDILRLAVTLTGGERSPLGTQASSDLNLALTKLREQPWSELKHLLPGAGPGRKDELIGLISTVFSLTP